MAIFLSSEEKNIENMFNSSSKYIIPSYQRPYSWGEKECAHLWDNLWQEFEDKENNEYFLGNIVFAKSNKFEAFEVIDGQQRLITLTLFLRALQFFDENTALETSIWDIDKRDSNKKTLRVQTKVFEYNEKKEFEEAIDKDLKNDKCIKKKTNLFIDNLCFFYRQLSEKDKREITSFTDYFLSKVSLLPIIAQDSNAEKARMKALTIFETINNRGKELSDVDILKAELYNVALNLEKAEDFIDRWKILVGNTKEIVGSKVRKPLSYLFRIYTHILRGKNKDAGREYSLIDFFTRDKKDYSKLKSLDYIIVLDDLNKILLCIEFFSICKENRTISNEKYLELTPWFQVIDEYTNNYPYYILYVYLFRNGKIDAHGKLVLSDDKVDELVKLSKNLIKLVYLNSQAMSIKVEVFNIIAQIAQGQKHTFKKPFIESDTFEFLNDKKVPRKKGFILLYYYLTHKNKTQKFSEYYFDSFLSKKDVAEEEYDLIDSIGNMIVVNERIRKKNFKDKIEILKTNTDEELVSFVKDLEEDSSSLKKREERIISTVKAFFEQDD